MDLVEATTALRKIAVTLAGGTAETSWYLFGSFVHQPESVPADFDLLVVYEEMGDAQELRRLLGEMPLPLDLLFLTKEEEREFNFIERQGAVCIFPECEPSLAAGWTGHE